MARLLALCRIAAGRQSAGAIHRHGQSQHPAAAATRSRSPTSGRRPIATSEYASACRLRASSAWRRCRASSTMTLRWPACGWRNLHGISAPIRRSSRLRCKSWLLGMARCRSTSQAGALYAVWLQELQAGLYKPHVPESLKDIPLENVPVVLAALENPDERWFATNPEAGRDRLLKESLAAAIRATRNAVGKMRTSGAGAGCTRSISRIRWRAWASRSPRHLIWGHCRGPATA